jgi:hypothetical protein
VSIDAIVWSAVFVLCGAGLLIGSLWRPRHRDGSCCPCRGCASRHQEADAARRRTHADDYMKIADAVREQPWRYPCGCTPARKCVLHDGDYWRALERREGISP